MSENFQYRKVFVARAFDNRNQKPFVIVGTSYSSDAIARFTEKQVAVFHIGILFSKNFFNNEVEEILPNYIEHVNELFAECAEEFETTLNFGSNTNCYYVNQNDFERILNHLNASLPKYEAELKKIKKQNL